MVWGCMKWGLHHGLCECIQCSLKIFVCVCVSACAYLVSIHLGGGIDENTHAHT